MTLRGRCVVASPRPALVTSGGGALIVLKSPSNRERLATRLVLRRVWHGPENHRRPPGGRWQEGLPNASLAIKGALALARPAGYPLPMPDNIERKRRKRGSALELLAVCLLLGALAFIGFTLAGLLQQARAPMAPVVVVTR
jgi:hypothetical protein